MNRPIDILYIAAERAYVASETLRMVGHMNASSEATFHYENAVLEQRAAYDDLKAAEGLAHFLREYENTIVEF